MASIDLHIHAENSADLHQTMLSLLAGTAVAGAASPPTTEVQEPTKPKGGRGKAKADEGNAGSQGSDAGATSSAGQSSAAGEAVTKDTLNPRIMQLAQKSGPTAVAELFGEFGAKKFSEVPEDKYVALNARLDDLLA